METRSSGISGLVKWHILKWGEDRWIASVATGEERLEKSNNSRMKLPWHNQEWNIVHPAILLPFLQNKKTVVHKNNFHRHSALFSFKWREPGEVDTLVLRYNRDITGLQTIFISRSPTCFKLRDTTSNKFLLFFFDRASLLFNQKKAAQGECLSLSRYVEKQ